MLVKDFITFLQSLPPDAEVAILTADEYASVGGGVFYEDMGELVLLGEDTQIEFSDEVAEGRVREFGTVNYFFDKGISEENFEEEIEMSANAEELFTPEVVEAIINEQRIKNALEHMSKEDTPLLPAPTPPVVIPNPNSCEEDA